MTATPLRAKAEAFRSLHTGPSILVLPNAWDVASALVVEATGFPAVATTSAGIALSYGYPDGQKISRAEMLEAVSRIAQRVGVPVTADMEAGYGPTVADVVETVRGVIDAGTVGLNLEDSTGDSDSPLTDVALQVERIRAARAAAEQVGVPVVLNARTDVYLREVGDLGSRFEHAVRRANAYREAGADCLFVPGVSDPEIIARLVQAIRGPVNILAGPNTPPVPELARLGVARVSVGAGPYRAALGLVRRIAQELLGPGTYSGVTEGAIPYAEVQALLARRGEG